MWFELKLQGVDFEDDRVVVKGAFPAFVVFFGVVLMHGEESNLADCFDLPRLDEVDVIA